MKIVLTTMYYITNIGETVVSNPHYNKYCGRKKKVWFME